MPEDIKELMQRAALGGRDPRSGSLDKEIGEKFATMKGKTVAIVMDHGVVEVFEA